MTSTKHYGKQTGQAISRTVTTPAGGVRLETFIPWTLVRRGLKKQVITPLDAPQEFLAEAKQERAAHEAAQDSALMRALGLAHHWQRLLDEGRVASVADIAKAEGMDVTQVRRVLRLTLLAPEVIERLVGASDFLLEQVMRGTWPDGWGEQMRQLASFT
ncbi:MAG: LacI family transcriptional regulator [Thiobacillaceae bacterium]